MKYHNIQLLLLVLFVSNSLCFSQTEIRINAGGAEVTYQGLTFENDDTNGYYSAGSTTSGGSHTIVEPYNTERISYNENFTYDFPVPNGNYQVVLHFAESYFGDPSKGGGGAGSRVFDVDIEGLQVLDNYDIFAKVGVRTPTTETFTSSVNDGELNIYFSSLAADGGTDLPKISAIEVLSIANSDTQVPTISSFTSSNLTSSSVDLSWTASDNVGIVSQSISDNSSGTYSLNATQGTTTVNGLSASTLYVFTLTITDAAGNAQSAALNITTNDNGSNPSTGGSVWTESNAIASYNGSVAIGISTVPNDYKMAINGKLITEEVRVEPRGNWPDYVFDDDHDLPTLEEVENHIKTKGHLVNIPSAEEVAQNGIQLGEMNKLLLEKIEELTLYVIDLKKQNNTLSERVYQLEKSNPKFILNATSDTKNK